MRLVRTVLLLAALAQVPWAMAVEMYRYQNAQGIVVLDRQGVPPEFISKGYQVLNAQGRVVREVPPAPSLEERKRQLEEQAQAKADQQLLRLYSTPEDVDRARDRTLKEHDKAIDKANNHLQSLARQKSTLEQQAASQERAGQQVSKGLLEQLESNARQTQEVQAQLERLARERQTEQQFYQNLRQRLERVLEKL